VLLPEMFVRFKARARLLMVLNSCKFFFDIIVRDGVEFKNKLIGVMVYF
jgi:hypothetical protein